MQDNCVQGRTVTRHEELDAAIMNLGVSVGKLRDLLFYVRGDDNPRIEIPDSGEEAPLLTLASVLESAPGVIHEKANEIETLVAEFRTTLF